MPSLYLTPYAFFWSYVCLVCLSLTVNTQKQTLVVLGLLITLIVGSRNKIKISENKSL